MNRTRKPHTSADTSPTAADTPPASGKPSPSPRPTTSRTPSPPDTTPTSVEIVLSDLEPCQIKQRVWEALANGTPDQRLYQQNGRPVFLTEQRLSPDNYAVTVKVIGPGELVDLLTDGRIRFRTYKMVMQNFALCKANHPQWLVTAMCSGKIPDCVPVLEGVTDVPYLWGRSVVTKRGYNPDSGWYLTRDWSKVHVPETMPEACAALRHWLIDFDLKRDSDLCNAVALPLTYFLRPMIYREGGVTPAFVFEAPSQGSGKSILARILMSIGMSKVPGSLDYPEDDNEEMNKTILPQLQKLAPTLFFDNVEGVIGSKALARTLTGTTISGRILGRSEVAEACNRSVWVFTGNNAELNTDMARRSMIIRLQSDHPAPWKREEDPNYPWVHPNIEAHTASIRDELVGAFVALLQHYAASGPPVVPHLASFGVWSKYVGGVLLSTGMRGWLGNRDEMFINADTKGAEMAALIEAWAEAHGADIIGSDPIIRLAKKIGVLGGELGDVEGRAMATRLGKHLARFRGRVYGDWRLICGTDENGAPMRNNVGKTFKLVKVDRGAARGE